MRKQDIPTNGSGAISTFYRLVNVEAIRPFSAYSALGELWAISFVLLV